jgi:hypothetical protein
VPEPDELLVKVETLQNLLIDMATSGGSTAGDYVALRNEFLSNPVLRAGLPKFVHTCRDLSEFWQFIKYKYPTYKERREYIWGEFRPLLENLEAHPSAVMQPADPQLLAKLSPEAVQAVWQRALERRTSDPEGAITAARALLETVCKHILEEMEIEYDDSADLPRLYRMAAETLKIAPSQHTEAVFKQILGGCTAVVEGLGALRNKLGDAHGGGMRRVRPAPRHAQLAVNLSGAMTAFLVATWEARKTGEK